MKRSLSMLAVGLLLAACNNAPAMTESGDLFFPTQEGPRSGMQALYRGPLVVRDGCVLIGGPDDYTVPIWPNGFTVEPDESGRVVVRDSEGTVVAIDGETFEMGGGPTAQGALSADRDGRRSRARFGSAGGCPERQQPATVERFLAAGGR